MPTYDTISFDPPAPVVSSSIRSQPDGILVTDVPLLIDTGADITLLPADFVRSFLEVKGENKQYELQGFDGTRSFVPAVDVEMHLLGKIFRGQFLVIEQECGILGRNVLNALSLLLDGPNLRWGEKHK